MDAWLSFPFAVATVARFRRASVVALSAVLFYAAYAFALAPVLAPPYKLRQPSQVLRNQPVAVETRNSSLAVLEEIAPWLPPGSWELNKPRVLQGDQLILLHEDYHPQEDGSVQLNPCTLIFRLDRHGKEVEGGKRMIVMRAPKGATLRFDAPFNLRQPKMRKLVRGALPGDIVIYGNTTANGPIDELKITAQDIVLQEDKILTPHAVDFRIGQNHGRGRNLVITLTRGESSNAGALAFGELETVQLLQDVQVSLAGQDVHMRETAAAGNRAPNQSMMIPASTPSGSASFGNENNLPLEISCQGRFIFDVRRREARFEQNVDVLRIHPQGPADVLSCEALSLLFEARDTSTKGGQVSSLGRLQPRSLAALGSPVVVRSPSNNAEARGGKLTYDLQDRRIRLEPFEGSRDLVTVQQADNQISAPILEYQMGNAGQLGAIRCAGPGFLKAQGEILNGRTLSSSWDGELQLKPDQDGHVLTILGNAMVDMKQQGKLSANEIWLWFKQVPGDTRAAASQRTARNAARRPTLEPKQMLAAGNTHVDSPVLTADTGRLQLDFVVSPRTARVSSSQGPNRTRPLNATLGGAAGSTPASETTPPNERYQLTSDQMFLQVDWSEQPELRGASLEGSAKIAQFRAEQPERPSLEILGDRVAINDLQSPKTSAMIAGSPARIISPQVDYQAAVIRYSRKDARIWSDGAGNILMPLSDGGENLLVGLSPSSVQASVLNAAQSSRNRVKGAQAEREPPQNQAPRTMSIQYQGGMQFDGQTIRFTKQVLAKTNADELRTSVLEAQITPRLDLVSLTTSGPSSFAQHASGETDFANSRPTISVLRCKEGVWAEHRSMREGVLENIAAVDAAGFELDRRSGAVKFAGPGKLSYVGTGGAQDLDSETPSLRVPFTPPAPPAPLQTAEQQLSFLRVDFQHQANGNMHQRFITFGDRVDCIYGPVNNWAQTLDPRDSGEPRENEVVIRANKLTVRSAGGTDISSAELEANENVYVLGNGFAAQGERMVYSRGKDHLLLEGAGQGVAELWYKPKGSERVQLRARTIDYWRATNKVNFTGLQFSEGVIPTNAKLPGPARLPGSR